MRVPPHMMKGDLDESIYNSVINDYIGEFTHDKGLFIALTGIKSVGEGIIVQGDGAIYYETEFEMLAYKPVLHEVVEGDISEITEFGAFVRIGPIDALVHVSQIMDDYVSYSKTGNLQGKTSNKSLKIGDKIVGRVIAVSLKTLQSAKIGLTMRQHGLGTPKWIKEEKAEAAKEKKKEEKAEAPKEEKKPEAVPKEKKKEKKKDE